MTIFNSYLIGLLPLMLVIVAVTMSLLKLFTNKRIVFNTLYLFSITAILLVSIYIFYMVVLNNLYGIYCFGGWNPPLGICFVIDGLSATMVLILSIIYLIVSLYTIWYTRHISNYVYFYIITLIHGSGLLGIFLTSDIFNLYVFIELTSLTAYSLIMFYHRRLRSLIASTRYALLGTLYAGLLLLAIAIAYSVTGTLSMVELIVKIKGLEDTLFSNILYGDPYYLLPLLLVGLWTGFLMSALFPNHFWLPDAHSEAPSPASALLSGLTVNSGIYVVIRIMYTLYYGSPYMGSLEKILDIMIFFGITNIVYGSFKMAIEDDVKRILAYSTIVNIGYIYMGLGIGTVLGLSASILHLINHSIGKALAFLCIGVIVHRYRSRNIYVLEGLGKSHPVTMAFLIVSVLHLIGLPPLAGFYSKLLLFQAFMDSGAYLYAIMIIVGTALSVYGYIRLIEHLWHHPMHYRSASMESLPITIVASFTLASVIILLMGLFSYSITSLLNKTLHEVLHNPYRYIEMMSLT